MTKKTQPRLTSDEAQHVGPEFLNGLDLDLEDLLDQSEMDRMIRETKRATKPRPQPAVPEKAEPAVKPSPWRATKVILIMQETQCRCGATFQHPAANWPLAHFDHVRDPSKVWEVAAHPSTLNENLPRETRMVYAEVAACPNCFSQTSLNLDEETKA